VRVERVDPCPTVKPNVTSYLVTAVTIEEQPRTVQFQTIKALDASFCKETGKRGSYIWVWSKQSRYGWDIVKVAPDTSKFQHDEAV
jgi:hypothetical protein